MSFHSSKKILIKKIVSFEFATIITIFCLIFLKMSATPKQMDILTNYMEEHVELAKNYSQKSVQGRCAMNKMWEDLASQLNAHGPPLKSVVSWRKVWTDLKYRAKKKVSNNLISLQKTGGGPSEEVPLTELEEKVVQMTSLRDAVAGGTANVFGALASVSCLSNVEQYEDVEFITETLDENIFSNEQMESPKPPNATKRTSSPLHGIRPKKLKSCNDTAQILRNQIEMDNRFQNNVLALLGERNQQEVAFHNKVINLLEKRNEIALMQLEKD